jgi:hypothetical protein
MTQGGPNDVSEPQTVEQVYRDALVRIEEVVGMGAPDIIVANTMLAAVNSGLLPVQELM